MIIIQFPDYFSCILSSSSFSDSHILGLTPRLTWGTRSSFELKDSHKTLGFIHACSHLGVHTQIHTRTRKILTSILGSLRDPYL